MGYVIAFVGIFVVVFAVVAASAALGSASVRPKEQRQRFVQRSAIVALVIAALGTFGIYKLVNQPSASFIVTVRTFKVLPDQYVRVYLNITNTSTVAGAPDCGVTVQPTNSYGDDLSGSGVNAGDWASMKPGATIYTYLDVLVSDNEAHDVTSTKMITASC